MERIISLTQRAGIATLVVGVTVDFFIFDVDAGKRAVIFDMLQGVQQTTIGEGTHFKIPYIQVCRSEPIAPRHSQTSDLTFYCAYPCCQRPIIMDIRARPRIINSSTGTKDLQMVIALCFFFVMIILDT